MTVAAPSGFPAAFSSDYDGGPLNRVTTFFRGLLIIPAAIFAWLFSIGVGAVVFAAWFALLFTGRYPQGMYDFVTRGIRALNNVSGYGALLTDQYPPFSGDPDAAYPLHSQFGAPQADYSRLRVFFRGLLSIPFAVVAWLYGVGMSVVTFLAWFAILFTGRYPEGMYGFAVRAADYQTRYAAFVFLLTDQWPTPSEGS